MKKINLEQESSFDLEMEIHGDVASGSTSKIYFTIIAETMRVAFEGKRVEAGVYRINIPVLKNILPSGKYDFEVNVIIDGKTFSPITESVELVEEVKPVVKMKETASNTGDISIKISESKNVIKESPKPARLEKIGVVER